MKEINMDDWDRKEHFNFFFGSDLPFYNTNVSLDITGLKGYAKSRGLSVNNTIMFLITKTVNSIDNFLYRLIDGKVFKIDKINPSFACLRGNEELFRVITLEFNNDIILFDKHVKEAIQNSKTYFDLSMLRGRTDFVFLSPIPWISFTGLDHTLSLKKEDAIPRISWGKFYESNGRTLLPLNIQVNHIFIDGIHVGKFLDLLQEEIRKSTNAS
jgi:chloramphenicol O-acetyltransferase type A